MPFLLFLPLCLVLSAASVSGDVVHTGRELSRRAAMNSTALHLHETGFPVSMAVVAVHLLWPVFLLVCCTVTCLRSAQAANRLSEEKIAQHRALQPGSLYAPPTTSSQLQAPMSEADLGPSSVADNSEVLPPMQHLLRVKGADGGLSITQDARHDASHGGLNETIQFESLLEKKSKSAWHPGFEIVPWVYVVCILLAIVATVVWGIVVKWIPDIPGEYYYMGKAMPFFPLFLLLPLGICAFLTGITYCCAARTAGSHSTWRVSSTFNGQIAEESCQKVVKNPVQLYVLVESYHLYETTEHMGGGPDGGGGTLTITHTEVTHRAHMKLPYLSWADTSILPDFPNLSDLLKLKMEFTLQLDPQSLAILRQHYHSFVNRHKTHDKLYKSSLHAYVEDSAAFDWESIPFSQKGKIPFRVSLWASVLSIVFLYATCHNRKVKEAFQKAKWHVRKTLSCVDSVPLPNRTSLESMPPCMVMMSVPMQVLTQPGGGGGQPTMMMQPMLMQAADGTMVQYAMQQQQPPVGMQQSADGTMVQYVMQQQPPPAGGGMQQSSSQQMVVMHPMVMTQQQEARSAGNDGQKNVPSAPPDDPIGEFDSE